MADKDDVWTKVKLRYPVQALIGLTNLHSTAASTVSDTVGIEAAADVLGYWNMYAEVLFDVSDDGHMAVAVDGVIATLMKRKIATPEAHKEWDLVFGDEGKIAKLRRTGPRSRRVARTSGPDNTSSGNRLPYSHPRAIGRGANVPSSRGDDGSGYDGF